jgi:F-type H+-transporting ATPase subunit alpha
MERAGNFNEKFGGGSVTYLGIAETQQGDLTGYIPSNLASMCDGQICMSTSMFAEGIRPAIDFTLSLSIIGGRVQPAVLRAITRDLRAEYARYNEVVKLSKLQSSVSGESERLVKRGRAILGVLQQSAQRPVGVGDATLLMYALHKGLLDGVSDAWMAGFRDGIGMFARKASPDLLDRIVRARELTADLDRDMGAVIAGYCEANPST